MSMILHTRELPAIERGYPLKTIARIDLLWVFCDMYTLQTTASARKMYFLFL